MLQKSGWLIALAFPLLAQAAPVTGSGTLRIDVAEDRVWTDTVPANGVRTERPGVFYPLDASGNGPKNVETVVFKNVKLAEIESFSAKIGVNLGKGDDTSRSHSQYCWRDALVVTKAATTESIGVQFHLLRTPTSRIGTNARFLFRQVGDDVAATLENFTFFYEQNGQHAGVDWIGGLDIPVVQSLYDVGDQAHFEKNDPSLSSCVGYLSYTLKAGVDKTPVPDELVFRSTTGDPEPKSLTYAPYLMNDFIVIGKGVHAMNLVSASAIYSCGTYEKGEFLVQASSVTNDTAKNEKVFIFQRKYKPTSTSTRRMGATVRVAQSNDYVLAKVERAYHSYDDKAEDAPLGNYFYKASGATLATTNEMDVAEAIAIRDVVFNFSTESVPTESRSGILERDKVQLIWPGVQLADVEPGPALMGGGTIGGVWHSVSGWFTTNLVNDAVVQTYYQYASGNYVRTIRVEFQQEAEGVYAHVVSLRYNYKEKVQPPYWDGSLPHNYDSVYTNVVDGLAPKGDGKSYNTLALSQVVASRRPHAVRTVTLATGAQMGGVPVRLVDVDLALAPGEAGTAVLPAAVSGDGRVIVANGTTQVAADRTLAVPVEVSAGATLALAVTPDGPAQLTVPQIALAAGARVYLVADSRLADLTPTNPKTFVLPVVTGAENAEFGLSGAGFSNCRIVGLESLEDGRLAVTVKSKGGLAIVVR
ncbi:MAG: hypothetical protein ACI4RA_04965 [Kiritimatiellia bacterium]